METPIQIAGARIGTFDDLLALMRTQLAQFDAARDNRAAFLRVYATMTASVRNHTAEGFFIDPAWIERVAIRFAWWYFDALDRFERDASPPPAWAYAHLTARRKNAFLLQDILLGMNAHINNDLPLVVADILRAEGDEHPLEQATRRRFDHDQINRVLHLVIPAVEEETARHYGRLIRTLGRLTGTLDQSLSTFGLKTWRDNVWRNATFLLAAQTEAERQTVIRFIQEDALHVARTIHDFPLLRWCRPLAPVMRRWHLC
ncbi:MAG: hypothetical protein K0R39_981 [Symbiobacteriaceae bacterium]|jgi:hypothetical protein|nr:hypothetical protein [Symbiobacteriaceae bacterium]